MLVENRDTLGQATDLARLVRPDEGEVSRRIFVDPDVHRAELERIFARNWLLVAHESEIPRAGDYVTRWMGNDPVIVARTEHGVVRVFLNTCRHRGMQVCRADLGNTSHFRCPYHGWTYKNTGDLIGVPAHKEAYADGLDRSRLGLVEPPHVETLHGFVFASWEPDAPTLDDYLGDMRWYLDILFGKTDGGVEVVGTPQRWEVEMNWKLGADNFSGDGYHVAMTHRHALELGLFGGGSLIGHTIHTEQGHTCRIQNPPPGIDLPRFLALPEEVLAHMRRRLSPEQQQVIESITVMHGNVFPNLSFVDSIFTTTGDPALPPISFLNVRLWQPRSPTTTEVWSWLLVPAEAPDWWKDASRVTFVRTHGVGGTFDADDIEVWSNITGSNRGAVARRHAFNYEMGLHREPDPTWPGPGIAYAADYNEANQRAFYRQWLRLMNGDA
jgi:phenylpropionate dioxygenase-like ring-hydroxylating dioxygenase large terminal subunit